MLKALTGLLTAVEGAATAQPPHLGYANFLRKLQATVRARLPDLQTLLALHISTEKALQETLHSAAGVAEPAAAAAATPQQAAEKAATSAATPAAASASKSGKSKKRKAESCTADAGKAGKHEPADDATVAAPAGPAAEIQEAASPVGDSPADEGVSGTSDADEALLLSQPQLLVHRVLSALAWYTRWLPEAAADARFEPFRLLPQVRIAG